jgi:small subunit ribosomal protein S1
VDAIILSLDREERKMSLGIKQLTPDPWVNITTTFPVGSQHKGTVRNFTNFGVFVELAEGVDGLVHISDLSWTKKIKHPGEFTSIGAELDVKVLEIDGENRRLSLGHKQLEENPWDVFETIFTVDSVHKGTIVSINDKGATIALPYGIEAIAPVRHIVKEDGKQAKVEEILDFKVLEFGKEQKRITVSHTKIHNDKVEAEKAAAVSEKKQEEVSTKAAVKKVKDSVEKTTLGDLDVLANLRNELETSERKKKK